MITYVILSRFSPEAFKEPHEFEKLGEAVFAKIKSECSGIRWKDSYASLGRFDVVDVVEANDPKQIEKAAMTIRAYGHSNTETSAALRHFDEAIGAIERLVAKNVQAERRMTSKSGRSLSAAARRKIARAQKARWAKLRQGKAAS